MSSIKNKINPKTALKDPKVLEYLIDLTLFQQKWPLGRIYGAYGVTRSAIHQRIKSLKEVK